MEDWKAFLADRAAKGFTVIQYNVVSPWRTAPTDADGRTALVGKGPARIDVEYFKRLDPFVAEIAKAGLLAAPVMLWAHKSGDAGFDLPDEECLRLARHQFARWNAYPTAWIAAGDVRYRGAEGDRWKRLGRALFDPASGGRAAALVTTHPTGENWPWADWREEKWLTFLGYQSGHGDGAATWKWLVAGPPGAAADAEPRRPIVNLEPAYEDHLAYQSKKPHSAYNVRRACYASLLVDAPAGVTYGAHGIWSWELEAGKTPRDHGGSGVARPWKEAAQLPGSFDVQRMAAAFEGFRWWKLRPAPQRIKAAPPSDDPGRFTLAAASEDGRLLVAYLAAGGTVQLDLAGFDAAAPAYWFDPRTGKKVEAKADEAGRFAAPDEQDWLLVVGK